MSRGGLAALLVLGCSVSLLCTCLADREEEPRSISEVDRALARQQENTRPHEGEVQRPLVQEERSSIDHEESLASSHSRPVNVSDTLSRDHQAEEAERIEAKRLLGEAVREKNLDKIAVAIERAENAHVSDSDLSSARLTIEKIAQEQEKIAQRAAFEVDVSRIKGQLEAGAEERVRAREDRERQLREARILEERQIREAREQRVQQIKESGELRVDPEIGSGRRGVSFDAYEEAHHNLPMDELLEHWGSLKIWQEPDIRNIAESRQRVHDQDSRDWEDTQAEARQHHEEIWSKIAAEGMVHEVNQDANTRQQLMMVENQDLLARTLKFHCGDRIDHVLLKHGEEMLEEKDMRDIDSLEALDRLAKDTGKIALREGKSIAANADIVELWDALKECSAAIYKYSNYLNDISKSAINAANEYKDAFMDSKVKLRTVENTPLVEQLKEDREEIAEYIKGKAEELATGKGALDRDEWQLS